MMVVMVILLLGYPWALISYFIIYTVFQYRYLYCGSEETLIMFFMVKDSLMFFFKLLFLSFQDKLLDLKVQQANLEELVVSLRQSSPDNTAPATITEWQSKLGDLRLVELRLTRANQKLHDKVKQLESLIACNETSLAKLEEKLVAVTKVG